MKVRIVSIIVLSITLASCEENVVRINEVPAEIIATKPCATLYPRFKSLFPEFVNNESKQAVLFSDTVQKRIVLTRDTDVYLTFISEGATLQNTLGWYAFTTEESSQNPHDVDWHILFPNVSNKVLAAGDRLKLSDQLFKKGTVIGFFLIADGWQNGVINYNKTTFFSTLSSNVDQLQQHVLFKEKTCGDLVLAFEDVSVTQTDCDHDFNDIIFTVSDNNANLENTSFEQSHIAIL
ncbi:MAG: DUF4114 domain-containing protein [Chryseolinea sp.]